ncbi:MFS transporter [Microbacterium sp. SORGH_AS_0888]|uniref:MFS transporter n=1 Tax=Microbacterium sp. SORGH_AS_0888 TaxID=3041791 RepID=UPI0027D89459|nr:MFS transporter [Microbacterium sp. SORGH_AS_0888]
MPVTGIQAEHRLIVLTLTRWLPVGLVSGLTVLLPLERGLTLPEVGVLLSLQGFIVLALEIPTGGLADTLGRRPLLIASGVLAVASTSLMVIASSFWMFALALVIQGVFRALDSGPLEAWYVDAATADDPRHPVERGLSRAATALGTAIAVGAAVCGALVVWHPLGAASALTLPYVLAAILTLVHTGLLWSLVREAPRPRAPARGRTALMAGAHAVPRLLRRSTRVLRRSRVLRALVLVEVFWSVAMIGFETLTPVKLSAELGGEDAAAALFAPASAAAWALFAAGSLAAGRASRRIGVARTAILARLLNGGFVVAMGMIAGPVGLLVAYGLAYLTHGAAGPMHSALLHREATSDDRALVLSLNSMVAGGTYSIGLLVLTPLAAAASPGAALVTAGAFSVLGSVLYVPALRQERDRARLA